MIAPLTGKGLDLMRRVPANPIYSLLGSGRLAQHLSVYLKLTDCSFFNWSRNLDPKFNSFSDMDNEHRLSKTLKNTDVILLAISDDALSEMVEKVFSQLDSHQVIIHFSAARKIEDAVGLHPLMTFTDEKLADSVYEKIPFCEPEEALGCFKKIFPHWNNPVFSLSPKNRALYHAYLVAAGNFTSLLWRDVEEKFQKNLGLKPEFLELYRDQIFSNIKSHGSKAVTGPLMRGDRLTMDSNLSALENDELAEIYKAFEGAFAQSGGQQ